MVLGRCLLRLVAGLVVVVAAGSGSENATNDRTSEAIVNASATTPVPLELPNLDDMLSEAAHTVDEFTEQATVMQNNAEKAEWAREAILKTTRDSYAHQLAEQEHGNLERGRSNEALNSSITFLVAGNRNLMIECQKLRKRNHVLRNLLHAVWPKIGIASNFLDDAINVSVQSTAGTAVQVLQPKVPEPTLEHFLGVMRGVANEQTSLLQFDSSKRLIRKHQSKKDGPEEFIVKLQKGLEDLGKAQDEGGWNLKASFLANREKGEKSSDGLAMQRARLDQALQLGQSRQAELYAAKSHLTQTGTSLVQRVKAIRLFLENADMAAAKSMQEDDELNSGVDSGNVVGVVTESKKELVGDLIAGEAGEESKPAVVAQRLARAQWVAIAPATSARQRVV